MKTSICDNRENRYVCLYVIQLVKFYSTFAVMKFCPAKYRQAERYGGGIKGIHLIKYKEILDTLTILSCNSNNLVCKILENAKFPYFVCFAEITASYTLAKAQMMEC